MVCNNKDIVAIELSLRGKYDTTDAITIWLTNQPILDENNILEYYPIIESIQGIGVEQNEFFPKFRSGSVRINNTRDAIAFEHRLTDLACNFVIQGATTRIYIGCLDIKDNEFTSDRVLAWEGEIQGVTYATRQSATTQRLTLNIGRVQPEHLITKKLKRSEFTTIPDRSVNKVLPTVLGFNQQVIPYPISEPAVQPLNGTVQRFAYAVNFEGAVAPRFRNLGVQNILAPDLNQETNQDSVYLPVKSAVDILTPVYKQEDLAGALSIITDLNKPRAFWVPYLPGSVVADSHIVTGIRISLIGNNFGAAGIPDVNGEISIKLHRQQPNANRPKPASQALATATVIKEDYASDWVSNDPFFVEAVFDKPVPIVGPGTYFWSFQGSNEDSPESNTVLPLIASNPGIPVGQVAHWSTDDGAMTQGNEDSWFAVGQTTPIFDLMGLVIGDFPAGDATLDLDGLGYSYTDLRYNDFDTNHPAGAQTLENLGRIDLIYEMDGLSDVDGTVTGVPGFILGNPLDQIEALFHIFDGISWVAGPFDDSRFSSTHMQYVNPADPFFRNTAGRTYGKATNISIIQDLGRNSYSTVVYDGIGGLGIYSLLAVGDDRPPVAKITDSDGRFERWFVNDLNQVINALDMNYARRLDNIHFQITADQDELQDYSKTLTTHFRDGGLGETLGKISAFHYGERRMRDEDFNFINSDESALHVSDLYFRLHDHPYEYAQVIVPYCDYKELRMYDVIQLVSTELPSIWGTNPNVYRNKAECWLGGQWQKSKPLEAEVVSMTLNYSSRGPLELRLLCRLLTQVNDPLSNFTPIDYTF